jgi:hypothetical protein
MGATAIATPKARRPGPNSAGRPSSAASNQPSNSETRLHLGRFPSSSKSRSPIETRATNRTAGLGKGRFPDACRRAGRDHGF